jgi:hypothetical protein
MSDVDRTCISKFLFRAGCFFGYQKDVTALKPMIYFHDFTFRKIRGQVISLKMIGSQPFSLSQNYDLDSLKITKNAHDYI